MKIVFFGTPYYVLPVLERLHKTFRLKSGESPISAVVTQRPKPAGRKQLLVYSPVDEWAHKHKLPIYFDPREIITNNIDADLGVLASFGQIIEGQVLDYFRYGVMNIHPSLLPLYRGSSPVASAIAMGETTTGATIIKLDNLVDHGPIVSSFKEEIDLSDNNQSLRDRLFERSAEVLCDLIPPFIDGKIKIHEQDHDKAVHTKTLLKEDGFIDFSIIKSVLEGKPEGNIKLDFIKESKPIKASPLSVHNFIRAMYPWPCAWTLINIKEEEKRLKIISSTIKENVLVINKVQLEGKNEVGWKQFNKAYGLLDN